MNLTLGIFDVFAYSVPGALYVGLIAYLLDRTSWFDVGRLFDGNATIAIVGIVLACYMLGQITYVPRRFLDRRMPRWLRGTHNARHEFRDRVPAARQRRFVDADSFLLFAALEIKAPESAVEVRRLRATGVALRNSGFALILAAVAAAVEVATGPHRGLASACVVGFALGALAALRFGFEHAHWAAIRTLEAAFWIPDIDTLLVP